MNLEDDDVIFCLGKAKEMAEQYQLYARAADNPRRSVDDLLWLCGEYLGKSVSLQELNLPAGDNEIRAVFTAMSDGSFVIYLLAELGGNERRFVECKELFHVILDQEKCRSMELYRHIEETTVSFSLAESHPCCSVSWEMLAEIAAMEFLFPYSDRVAVLAHAEDNPDFADLARRYGIPQLFIEGYLSKPMMDEFGALYSRIGATEKAA